MSRSYPSASKHTTQNERLRVYGIPKRQEQSNDIPEVREYEICIQKPRILVSWILCRHGRKNTAAIKAYIENQLKIDKETDQLSLFDPLDPFTGSR